MAFVSKNLELLFEEQIGIGQAAAGAVKFSSPIDLSATQIVSTGYPMAVRIACTTSFVAGQGTPVIWFGLSFNNTENFEDATNTTVASTVTTPVLCAGTGQTSFITSTSGVVVIPGGLTTSAMEAGEELWLPLPPFTKGGLGVAVGAAAANALLRYMAVSMWQPKQLAATGESYFTEGRVSATLEQHPSVNFPHPATQG